ncbi:hypothetical protein CUGBS08_00165 [Streptococcus agalactiae]|nr:hypothetical protein CUGBS08_00165 [Streptococcus agalactiae]WFZ87348.1 hypothetical protein [Streptococcus phage vB_Sags-UPM1]
MIQRLTTLAKIAVHIFKNKKGEKTMMINYFAMQIELGWITIDDVPAFCREKVRQLIEVSKIGTKSE